MFLKIDDTQIINYERVQHLSIREYQNKYALDIFLNSETDAFTIFFDSKKDLMDYVNKTFPLMNAEIPF